MKRRLAIIDLDGTLLGPDKGISRENHHALRRLQAAGFETVFASGRHHQNIVRFEAKVGAMSWVISSSGAVVRHAATNELLQELTLAEADSLALYAAGRKASLSLIVYHRDGIFMEKESAWTRLYAERAGWIPECAELSRLAASGLQKVLLSESPATMARIGPELEGTFGDRVYIVWTEDDLVEFLSAHANKAVGAEALARKLGLDRSDVVAFGDGNNDAEILAWAGFSVAMAHGRPAALAAASNVSPAGPPEAAFARAVDLVLGTRF